MEHTSLATNRRSVEKRTPDKHKPSAKSQSLENVRAASDPAVHHHRYVPGRSDDLRQHPQWRHRSIELPSAMIGHDDAIHPALPGDASILLVHDALDDQTALPLSPDLGEMFPVQVITHPEVTRDVPGDDWRATLRVGVLEMRHPVSQQGPAEGAERPARVRDTIPGEAQVRPQRSGKPAAD